MADKQKLLVVIELENSPAVVVERSAWLANLMDCELELLLCDSEASPIGRGFLLSHEADEMLLRIEEAQAEILADLIDIANNHGVEATSNTLNERPIADGITAYALNVNPVLIVKGTHYHSASQRSIIVGTDWQLMRTCGYPLYLVKNNSIKPNPVVVAAVDPMHEHDKSAELDQAIIDQAKFIVDSTGGQLHLFHSYQRLVAIGRAAVRAVRPMKLPVDEIDKRVQKEHRDALDALALRNDIDDRYVHQLPGRTHELLPSFVQDMGADLVVIGALARWGLNRMILGSTAERVLDHLPCDLLIVRAAEV